MVTKFIKAGGSAVGQKLLQKQTFQTVTVTVTRAPPTGRVKAADPFITLTQPVDRPSQHQPGPCFAATGTSMSVTGAARQLTEMDTDSDVYLNDRPHTICQA